MLPLLAFILLLASPGPVGPRDDPPANPPPVPAKPLAPAEGAETEVFPISGVTSIWLQSGIRVHIKPMKGSGAGSDSRADRCIVVVSIAGGVALETPDQRGITRCASGAWASEPVNSPPSPAPLRAEPEIPPDAAPADASPLRAKSFPWPEGLGFTVSIPTANATSSQDLRTLLKKVRTRMETPTIDPDRFAAWAGRERRRATQSGPPSGVPLDRDPSRAGERRANMAGVEAFMETLGSEGRGMMGRMKPAEIDRHSPEDAHRWLSMHTRQHPVEIAIVGDFNAAEASAAAVEILGSLPPRPRIGTDSFAQQRVLNRPPGPRQSLQVVEAMDPGTAHVFVAFPAGEIGDLQSSRALSAAARIIRQRADALLKDAGIEPQNLMSMNMPGRTFRDGGLMVVSAKVNGGDAAGHAADAVLRKALDELTRTGPTIDELRPIAAEMAADATKRLADPDYWAMVLPMCTLHGISPDALASAPDAYRAMTPDDVRIALTRWLVEADRLGLIAVGKPLEPGPPPAGPDHPDK